MSNHHNAGNEYAKKENPKSSWIQLRCTQEEKALIVRNLKDNENLTAFMMGLAIKESTIRNKK